MATNIRDVAGLAPHQATLTTLGYDTLEAFVGAARVARRGFESYLGVSIDNLLESLPEPEIPDEVSSIIRESQYPLGTDLRQIPQTDTAAGASFREALPSNINRMTDLLPIRDQNPRGTCVAHATIAAYEYYLVERGTFQEMSEQFMNWLCKRDSEAAGEGTVLGFAFPKLDLEGSCLETTWSYNRLKTPGFWAQGPPPAPALAQAQQFRDSPEFRVPGINLSLSPNSVTDIKAELVRRRWVAFSIPAFPSWYGNDGVTMTGDIGMPGTGETAGHNGHSMCIVGYEDDSSVLGGGRFIIRNSWGKSWGVNSRFGPGYGTIPYGFITRCNKEAYSIL